MDAYKSQCLQGEIASKNSGKQILVSDQRPACMRPGRTHASVQVQRQDKDLWEGQSFLFYQAFN